MNSIVVRLNEDFLEMFPGASVHALVAENLHLVSDQLVRRWQDAGARTVASWRIDPQKLVEEVWVSEWRASMKKMGVNAAKTRSSIEQLAKRALGGMFITTSIPTVNLYCAISVLAKVPMGGYRVESLKSSLDIRLSRGTETFLGIGDAVSRQISPGIVIYAIGNEVACYAWNHKDSALTCLTPSTDKAVFFADAVSVDGRARAEGGILLLKEALASCGATVTLTGALDSQTREMFLPLGSTTARAVEWDEVVRGS